MGRRWKTLAETVTICCIVALAGCGEPSDGPAPDSAASGQAGESATRGQLAADGEQTGAESAGGNGPESAGGGQDIQLVVADREVYQQTLDEHQGKVVLVDFWATWCVPCKTYFPKVLQYGRKYDDQGLAVVSVSLDDPSNRQGVVSFLKSVDAQIDNLISKWGPGTETMERFKIDSAVPYYKLYDRQGKLRYEFSAIPEGLDNVEPMEQMEPRIKQLLSE
jgi:thiol-disulfide isomerase/thioredoxin